MYASSDSYQMMNTFRKLIHQKKAKRLAYMLSQTDKYITNLTSTVKQHKMDQKTNKDNDEKQRKRRRKRMVL